MSNKLHLFEPISGVCKLECADPEGPLTLVRKAVRNPRERVIETFSPGANIIMAATSMCIQMVAVVLFDGSIKVWEVTQTRSASKWREICCGRVSAGLVARVKRLEIECDQRFLVFVLGEKTRHKIPIPEWKAPPQPLLKGGYASIPTSMGDRPWGGGDLDRAYIDKTATAKSKKLGRGQARGKSHTF